MRNLLYVCSRFVWEEEICFPPTLLYNILKARIHPYFSLDRNFLFACMEDGFCFMI